MRNMRRGHGAAKAMYGGGHAYQVHKRQDGAIGDCALNQCVDAGEHARQHHRGVGARPPRLRSLAKILPHLGIRIDLTLRPARSNKWHLVARAGLGYICQNWKSYPN